MNEQKYSYIQPFEICSIRPPTENYSLTFRLSRNCYWNKCAFCPVYKTGQKFSRRPLDEILADITSAGKILDLLMENLSEHKSRGTRSDLYSLINAVKNDQPQQKPGTGDSGHVKRIYENAVTDERMQWFMTWFKDTPDIEDSISHVYSWWQSGGTTCFLGDADSLMFKPDFISAVLDSVHNTFPGISRVTIYGRTLTAARVRTLPELKLYSRAGVDRVHFGVESGCSEVLDLVNKGVTPEEQLKGILKVKEAGLSASVYVMPGLGGAGLSERHAYCTADLLTKAAPDYVRLRTLEVFPGTPLEGLKQSGRFTEAPEEQVVREIRTIIEKTDAETEIVSDSAANLLEINGTLPHDRERMLAVIDSYLTLNSREKLEFSLHSRLNSFIGQYGGLSRDIYEKLSPFLNQNSLNISSASDNEIQSIIRLIRGKLMP
jgi:hypothetical protein